jgi:hypothetical protein
MTNVVIGFKVAGTFLFYWFTESDFLVSYITDHPIQKSMLPALQSEAGRGALSQVEPSVPEPTTWCL